MARWAEDEAAAGLAHRAGHVYGQLHARRGTGCGPVQADGRDPGWPTDVFTSEVAREAEEVLSRAPRLPQGLSRQDVATGAEIVEELVLPLRSRLVHGDASLSNILVRDGDIAAVIDFEVAWYADAAIDLAWWWWNSPATADDLQRGCDETSEGTDDRRLWVHRLRLLIGLANTFAHVNPDRGVRIGRLLRSHRRGTAAPVEQRGASHKVHVSDIRLPSRDYSNRRSVHRLLMAIEGNSMPSSGGASVWHWVRHVAYPSESHVRFILGAGPPRSRE